MYNRAQASMNFATVPSLIPAPAGSPRLPLHGVCTTILLCPWHWFGTSFHFYITANATQHLMTVGTVHAFMVPQMRRTPVNTSFVPDTACLLDWTEPQLLRLKVLLSLLFLGSIREELAEPLLALVPFFLFAITFQCNLLFPSPYPLLPPQNQGQ